MKLRPVAHGRGTVKKCRWRQAVLLMCVLLVLPVTPLRAADETASDTGAPADCKSVCERLIPNGSSKRNDRLSNQVFLEAERLGCFEECVNRTMTMPRSSRPAPLMNN